MIKVLGENYYIDLDKVEEYIDMSIQEEEDETMSGSTEMKINIIKNLLYFIIHISPYLSVSFWSQF